MTDALNGQLVDFLPQIRRVVSRIAKDEGVVDDIAQECCVRIIEKEELWKKQNKLSQWINSVTRNVTIDYLRKHWKEQKTASLEEEVLQAPKDKDFSTEDIRWVISQFQYLTPMQKKVMHLKYFEGMKSVEIAENLNITKSAVSQYSKTALETLRRKARIQGLFGILLPWNWDFMHWGKKTLGALTQSGIVAMKTKLIFSMTLIGLGFLGIKYVENKNEISDLNSNVYALRSENRRLQNDHSNLMNELATSNLQLKNSNMKILELNRSNEAAREPLKKSSTDDRNHKNFKKSYEEMIGYWIILKSEKNNENETLKFLKNHGYLNVNDFYEKFGMASSMYVAELKKDSPFPLLDSVYLSSVVHDIYTKPMNLNTAQKQAVQKSVDDLINMYGLESGELITPAEDYFRREKISRAIETTIKKVINEEQKVLWRSVGVNATRITEGQTYRYPIVMKKFNKDLLKKHILAHHKVAILANNNHPDDLDLILDEYLEEINQLYLEVDQITGWETFSSYDSLYGFFESMTSEERSADWYQQNYKLSDIMLYIFQIASAAKQMNFERKLAGILTKDELKLMAGTKPLVIEILLFKDPNNPHLGMSLRGYKGF